MKAALLQAKEDGILAFQSFEHKQADGLDLGELTFKKVVFQKCVFTDCNFSDAAFYECEFRDCAFISCRFQRSFWQQTALTGSKGDGGDFRKSRWKESEVSKSLFRYTNFTDSVWERDKVEETDFTEAAFQGSRFTRTAFSQVNFQGVDFFKAELKNIDLTTCNLDKIILSETCKELRGAKIHSTQAAVVAAILGIEVLP